MDEIFPYQSMREIQNSRLVLALLFATLLHIFVIATLPPPHVILLSPLPVPALKVNLSPKIRSRESTLAPLSNKVPELTPTNEKPMRKVLQVPPNPQAISHFDVPKNMLPAPAVLARPAAIEPSSPRISMGSLFGSIKNIVSDEARRMPSSKATGETVGDRPVLPQLAKALEKRKASVTQFADGLVKVVTPSGVVYCLKPLPDVVSHGGPVEPTVVPTNCP